MLPEQPQFLLLPLLQVTQQIPQRPNIWCVSHLTRTCMQCMYGIAILARGDLLSRHACSLMMTAS